ncbi:MAG: SelL-related redox protein [Chloracidobacterium sp.]|nr:SelL-related redox protein [Chloracidobacterium sp.]MDW8217819.1 SelL-related redox protein [Acidobacteriota bacterium]
MKQIPESILKQPVVGLNLTGTTLAEQLTGKTNLLVFLRHFGCVFCREIVADLRDIAAGNPHYPNVVFFFQGTVEQGQAFFARYWKEARAVSDTPLVFYKAFGVERGGWRELFGPDVWVCGLRAVGKGHFIGLPVGDPFVMPGAFLVSSSGDILWRHEFKHAGDHPDWRRIVPAAALAHA